MALLNQQKKDLFEAVSRDGFHPANFEFSDTPGPQISSKLILKNSAYFFHLTFERINAQDKWKTVHSPGESFIESKATHPSWQGLIQNGIPKWLQLVRRELETPDPWTTFSSQAGPDYATNNTDNTPLAVAEWEKVKAGVEQIRALLIEEVKGQPEAAKTVNEKLDSIIDGGKRMGRVDWFNQAIGALMNIIVAVSLSQEAQRSVWGIFKAAVAGIVHLLQVAPKSLGG